MKSTDLDVSPEAFRIVQERFPSAIGYGRAEGFHFLLRGQMRRMEKRGEIESIQALAKLDRQTGILMIPYVRYKTPGQVRRRQALQALAAFTGSVAALAGIGWLLWESRFVIMAIGAVVAGVVLLALIAPHWMRGCPGLHCEGCGG